MLLLNIIALPRSVKSTLLLLSDSVLLVFSLWLSFSLRLDVLFWPSGGVLNPIFWLVLLTPVVAIPIFIQFGLYRAIIRYLGMRAFWSVVKAVAFYAIFWGLIALMSGTEGMPRSVVIINFMVTLIGIGGSRLVARWVLRMAESHRYNQSIRMNLHQLPRVLIFGAGEAGRLLAGSLYQSKSHKLLGFIDDDPVLQGRDLMSLPILSTNELHEFVNHHNVDDILLAVPSISRNERNSIIERLRPLNVRVRTVPSLIEMAKGKKDFSELHELDLYDLLARDSIACDEKLMQVEITNHVIVVTGAGGSIGSELCRQIIKRKPKKLILFELNEFSLFKIHDELINFRHEYLSELTSNKHIISEVPQIIPLLGSVYDEDRVDDVINTWKPDVVYHAAALKHVPLVEQNIVEGIKTNIFGTLCIAKSAIARGVKRVILVSTDKAVNPTNAMGASKRVCEMVLQALAAETELEFLPNNGKGEAEQFIRKTCFSIVRFGNVLGSSGSVVPYFRDQIKKGGPITLTHPDITRYFMTIPEAAELVIQAGGMTAECHDSIEIHKNIAEVFVLDMGSPVKIADLAVKMIELSGHHVKDEKNPSGDIEVKIIGLREGEKLYEELLIGNNPQPTIHPRIMKARETFIKWPNLQSELHSMKLAALSGDVLMLRSILQDLVPEYNVEEKVADWVYKEKYSFRREA